ncbi:MAG TPA: ribosome-associated translation inhibitor RaiA [Oligoflexus sp.]|uniref:ribosome hibernation-promoting factor, HPF/YfiA family n=1 Tax=Oligoflexus sp. TaxID=1971216 RepID=UPI002D595FA1|nr:ribosome-associated translation inhibitor RaiA [Oligoflexus sp.]HYX35890.1 ribosome-associated translation inhibitor RaiA [Oligoflexus sp.]
MNFHYYFRHMTSSEAMKYDTERKMAGMESLIQTSMPIHVTYSVDADLHKVHVGLHARNRTLIEVEEVSGDMHKSLDMVMDNLHRQLSREKDRLLRHNSKADPFVEVAAPMPRDPADDFVEEEFAPAR